jgi:ADP-ribose pyrophosphatase
MVVATDPQGNILALQEYRYAVDQTLLNIPAGTIKRGSEDLQKAALRELQEETGYTTKNITKAGTLYEYPTKCMHTVTVFRAKDIKKTAQTAHEDTEQIQVTLMTPQQIKQATFSGQIKTASVLSALVLALPELFGGPKTDVA